MLLHPALIPQQVLYPHDLAYISWSIHNSIVSTVLLLGLKYFVNCFTKYYIRYYIRSPKFKTDMPILLGVSPKFAS